MTDIYLIRHGHVDYTPPNPINRDNPLTELGQRMARRVAARCEELRVEMVYASTMLRAGQTADALMARMPHLPRTDTPAFEEISLRDLEEYPGPMPSDDLNSWEDDHFAHANRAMWHRNMEGLEEVWATAREREVERVVIFAHAGPINALLRGFLGQEIVRLRTTWFSIDYTSISCIRRTQDTRWVMWTNDARHIEDLRGEYEA